MPWVTRSNVQEKELRSLLKSLQGLVNDRDYQTAVETCARSLADVDSRNKHRILGWRAMVEWWLGDKRVALEYLEQAHQLNPEWSGHVFEKAEWLLELGDYPGAIDAAGHLIDLETKRGSDAFIDAGWFIKAYAALLNKDRALAHLSAANIKDVKPIWLGGRMISKKDILESC